jgi:protein gp37
MENSNIGWTHHTLNPWRGCQHAELEDGSEHPGCGECYAEDMSERNPLVLGQWGPHGTRVMAAEAQWKLPLKWNAAAEAAGERQRVFCASLADVFEDWQGNIVASHGCRVCNCPDCGLMSGEEPLVVCPQCGRQDIRWATMDDLRARLFTLIDATPWLDWLLLTKRPQNIRRMWPVTNAHLPGLQSILRPNVWLITSVSDQHTAEELIPHLIKCRDLAPVLGISAEPLLAHVDLSWWLGIEIGRGGEWRVKSDLPKDPELDFVIVGGESGSTRRNVPLGCITSLVDQCEAACVACYVKQDVARFPGQQGRIPDEYWAVKQFPKVKAGA